MRFQLLPSEYWYGGCATWGIKMPLNSQSREKLSFTPNLTPNQGMPLLLSNKGRVLWLGKTSEICFQEGTVECEEGAELWQSGNTLRSAYLGAMERYFPFSGKAPAARLFEAPIFNTWIELTFHQSQKAILEYAHRIVENGFAPGVLMIDDGWSESYGDWRFHSGRFPDAPGMLRELHELGFQVMLWVCPYVTPDTMAYREAKNTRALLEKKNGVTRLAEWWNGFSAMVDLSREEGHRWLDQQLQKLLELGVDGFKFDGGDPVYYVESDEEKDGAFANELCRLWSEFGKKYPYNEYRTSWKAAGLPLMQRLCDKQHSWGEHGLAALVPDALAQGITGYPFCCADMVGGGEYLNFWENADRLDGELFVRHSAVSCLMPAIQFSAAPWRVLSKEENQRIHSQLALRHRYWKELWQAMEHCQKTGEPVVRYMEYEFPNKGLETVRDQFMVGSRLLAAPLLEKGVWSRKVYVPAGVWQYGETTIQSQGEWMEFSEKELAIVVLKRADTQES